MLGPVWLQHSSQKRRGVLTQNLQDSEEDSHLHGEGILAAEGMSHKPTDEQQYFKSMADRFDRCWQIGTQMACAIGPTWAII